MRYSIELFGVRFQGLGFVAVAMSLGGLLGALAAIIVNALVAAAVIAAGKKASDFVKQVAEPAEEEEEENGNGEDGDGDDNGDSAGLVDPNGGSDDWDKLWDVRTPNPAPVLPPRPPRGTPAPATMRDSDQTGVVEAGFVAVLDAPGVQPPTKRNESPSYDGRMMVRRG